ncbi:hypothetical protein [Edaphobacter aggregans]|uniref:hypothetical protein n=1 Tax=Edaphobacter aggregans TaxID=570835 RepID=UPI001FDF1E4A|nr:hypothetical protein [Edaphobacter aggregans]
MSDTGLACLASPDVLVRARKIKLFLMDVDGTLTDGGVCLISATIGDGLGEPIVSKMKVFNARDGQDYRLPTPWGFRQALSPADIHRPTFTGRG